MSEQQSSTTPPLTRGQKAAATRAANKLKRRAIQERRQEEAARPQSPSLEEQWKSYQPTPGDNEFSHDIKEACLKQLFRRAPAGWKPPDPRQELRRQPVVDLSTYRKATA